jgi:hypothetical protein
MAIAIRACLVCILQRSGLVICRAYQVQVLVAGHVLKAGFVFDGVHVQQCSRNGTYGRYRCYSHQYERQKFLRPDLNFLCLPDSEYLFGKKAGFFAKHIPPIEWVYTAIFYVLNIN